MTSSVNLNRLLARLEHNLLAPDADSNLQHSQYERNRIGANIEHARAMLLTSEKQSATIRTQSQREHMQTDLQEKRELIKKLNTRLRELNTAGDENDDEEDEDEEDVLNTYAPARNDTEAGLETGETQAPRIDESQQQELRSRKPNLQATDNRTAASTSAREQLFSGRSQEKEQPDPNLSQTETLMSHNRTEQEALTTGLLGLAQALKESSLQFSSSLEAEKDVRNKAESGLDKAGQGMDAAGKKMSTLRRMSEGQGMLGRLKLYGMIFGLWVACFLVVFVGPKIRF
ncbi:hypothetical protein M409DRAFT_20196 [Zasmidium cellare ATCC 36951]|uniref:t-SNARE coiled-coil homology domain-containing protein n=1 Tax=Zasmidium cellare ATCC 36951 TaxID=1080233 RepID=A0A6A6CVE1_ZASCE|nr:uncharacterized protein M409DRAFT_20196 [Zasmidium cellare ATCC 36951]KAF2169782.1 hypothetical protein M409DRAFT_20196 [Zasmidium cellare ATCC 36951]